VIEHRINLADLVRVHDRWVVRERVEVDLVELDVRGVPVHRIAFDYERVVRLPGFYLEWTTGDDVFRERPLVAKLLNGFARNDAKHLMGQGADEEWRWLCERNS
jgi:hypothetical protein